MRPVAFWVWKLGVGEPGDADDTGGIAEPFDLSLHIDDDDDGDDDDDCGGDGDGDGGGDDDDVECLSRGPMLSLKGRRMPPPCHMFYMTASQRRQLSLMEFERRAVMKHVVVE